MEEIEENTLAYCAGLLDGDGSFFIGKENGEVRQAKGYSACYTPIIGLSEVGRNSVDFLKSLFGGYIGCKKAYQTKDGSNRQEFHRWRVERSDLCLAMLEKITSFLVIKKERAEYLRDFIQNHIKKSVAPHRTTDEELEIRENHYTRMKQYNSDRFVIPNFVSRDVVKIKADNKFWSYVAGIMDSDGAFSLARTLVKGRGTYSYVPVIVLSQIDHRAIEYIYGGFRKGNRYLPNVKSCKAGVCYRYEVKGQQEIAEFLKNVIPFLRLKNKRAEILLKFCEIVPNHRYTSIEQEQRNCLYEELKKLNMGSINFR